MTHKDSKYPWIVGAMKYQVLSNWPTEWDAVRVALPQVNDS